MKLRHAHNYRFDSYKVNGHTHRLLGYTEYNFPLLFTHVHFYRGVCSYNEHTHYFSGFTGLPVRTENGHRHKMSGILAECRCHEHKYCHYTSENVEYTGKKAAPIMSPDTK